MTEDQARSALRAFVAVGYIEQWIAEQPWEATPGGWRVEGQLQGCSFRLEPVPNGVRVVMREHGQGSAKWTVPGQGRGGGKG